MLSVFVNVDLFDGWILFRRVSFLKNVASLKSYICNV